MTTLIARLGIQQAARSVAQHTRAALPRVGGRVSTSVKFTPVFQHAVSLRQMSTALAEEDLPSNLQIDDLECLLDEPEPVDETLLLRADLSEKVMPVVFLETQDDEQAEEDNGDDGADTDDAEPDDTSNEGATSTAADTQGVAQAVRVLDNRVFGVPIRRDIVHRVVTWQRARWRHGRAHTKTRAEVSGGGKKPWNQKGSGRARHGSIRSPLWRGGGKAHGKKRRDFSFKLNKKVRRMGMRVALAAKWREGNLCIVDVSGIHSHKTQDFLDALAEEDIFEEDGSVMLVDGSDVNETVRTASANLPWFSVSSQQGATVYSILKHHRLFLTSEALEELTERLVL